MINPSILPVEDPIQLNRIRNSFLVFNYFFVLVSVDFFDINCYKEVAKRRLRGKTLRVHSLEPRLQRCASHWSIMRVKIEYLRRNISLLLPGWSLDPGALPTETHAPGPGSAQPCNDHPLPYPTSNTWEMSFCSCTLFIPAWSGESGKRSWKFQTIILFFINRINMQSNNSKNCFFPSFFLFYDFEDKMILEWNDRSLLQLEWRSLIFDTNSKIILEPKFDSWLLIWWMKKQNKKNMTKQISTQN